MQPTPNEDDAQRKERARKNKRQLTHMMLEDMERVDLLLMKLDFAIDVLANARAFSCEELIDCCRRNGYSRVADYLVCPPRHRD